MYQGTDTNPEDSGVSPLWRKTAPPPRVFATLKGVHETDIAIVGAGIAGLSLSFHLSQLGVHPVVLEADEPGVNATGKSGGIISSLPARHSPSEIIKQCGEKNGRQALSLFGESAKYTFSLIKELGLNCSPQQSGFLAPAKPGKLLEKLKRISNEWQSLGYDIQYLDEQAIKQLSGLDIYAGSLLDKNGGGINPFAYAQELARVSIEQGVDIYSHSRVIGISKRSDKWCLKTLDGEVKANKLILCAGGDNRGLKNELGKTVMPLPVYEFSTVPLSQDIRKVLLPEDHALTDVHSNIFTIRFDIDGRLITAWPAFLLSNSNEKAVGAITKRLKHISPLLSTVQIEDVWQGTAWLGSTMLPEIYKHSGNLYSIQACNGRGLAMNTLLGREMAETLVSGGEDRFCFLNEQPKCIRPYGLMYHAPSLFINLLRSRDQTMNNIKRFLQGE